MADITVGDIRKAIKGMRNEDKVKLDVADPSDDANWQIDGVGNYGGVLQVSVSDHVGEAPEDDGSTPWYCQNCQHEGVEDDFIPSDGSPASHVCPECGSLDTFFKDDEEDDDGE